MTVLLTPLPQGRNAAQKALSQGCNCVTAGSIPETPRRKAKRAWQASRSARSKIYSQGSESTAKRKAFVPLLTVFRREKAAETRLCRVRDIVFRGEKPNGRKILLSAFAAAGERGQIRSPGRSGEILSLPAPRETQRICRRILRIRKHFFRQTDKRIAKFIPKEGLIYEKGDHQRKSERVSA